MQIGNATDVTNQFIIAAENFLAAAIVADGWKLREVSPTAMEGNARCERRPHA